jgi:hypothetical protein
MNQGAQGDRYLRIKHNSHTCCLAWLEVQQPYLTTSPYRPVGMEMPHMQVGLWMNGAQCYYVQQPSRMLFKFPVDSILGFPKENR